MSFATNSAKLANVAGVATALLVTASALWALFASLCHGMNGNIVGFGFMCETPACDPVLLLSIMPPQQVVIIAVLMLVFLGVPIGHLAYSTVKCLEKRLPPR